MSIRGRLQALKKVNEPTTTSLAVEHLIIGDDLYSIELYYALKKKGQDVRIICSHSVDLDRLDLVHPSSLRGEHNIKLCQRLYPQLAFEVQTTENLFYKDSKWREFGGRSKSEKILEGEEFYILPRGNGDRRPCFSCLLEENKEELGQGFNRDGLVLVPQKVEYLDSKWITHLSNGLIVNSSFLYWGNFPKDFTQIFQYPGEAYDRLIEYTDSSEAPGQLYWRAEIPSRVIEESQTLFIPQSYTHDWGHFIGEVNASGPGQLIEFISLFSIDDVSEEEIGRKIKAIKKGLEKIYPQLINLFKREYLFFSEHSASCHLSDSSFAETAEIFKGLSFVGENAPINTLFLQSLEVEGEALLPARISHFARGLMSIRQALL